MEFEILVSYDIENNKIRSKLFDKLKDFGLRPLQKSVFWGRIRKPEEKLLISYINQNIGKADSFFYSEL
jgi:CRISPR-associated protein Cas2